MKRESYMNAETKTVLRRIKVVCDGQKKLFKKGDNIPNSFVNGIHASCAIVIFELRKIQREMREVKVRTCRVCGCTDANCSSCIERTGSPCSWVANDLCSACVPHD